MTRKLRWKQCGKYEELRTQGCRLEICPNEDSRVQIRDMSHQEKGKDREAEGVGR